MYAVTNCAGSKITNLSSKLRPIMYCIVLYYKVHQFVSIYLFPVKTKKIESIFEMMRIIMARNCLQFSYKAKN